MWGIWTKVLHARTILLRVKLPKFQKANRRNTIWESQKVSAKSEPDSCRQTRFLIRHVGDLDESASCSSNPVLTEWNRWLDSCPIGFQEFLAVICFDWPGDHQTDDHQRCVFIFDATVHLNNSYLRQNTQSECLKKALASRQGQNRW